MSSQESAIKKVAVLDTRAGNLFSLFACLKRIGVIPVLISHPSQMTGYNFEVLIIPGQGRFGTVMRNLSMAGLDDVIKSWYQSGKKIIGICVGMQVFFNSSEEDPEEQGLGLISGMVTALKSPKKPMVGWCQLSSELQFLKDKTVYFVNSFAVTKSGCEVASVSYGERFVAAIKSKGLFAFQFHPEKSGKAGEEILKLCLA